MESGNPSQRLPWQHLSIILITVFAVAHVPSIHNGYSWFYAVQSRGCEPVAHAY